MQNDINKRMELYKLIESQNIRQSKYILGKVSFCKNTSTHKQPQAKAAQSKKLK